MENGHQPRAKARPARARQPSSDPPPCPELPEHPCYLDDASLSDEERWLLRKVSPMLGGELELHRLLALEPDGVAAARKDKLLLRSRLLALRERIRHDLARGERADPPRPRLVVIARPRFIPWPELDASLAADLERFLAWLRDEHRDCAEVLELRLGLGRPAETLEEVGARRGLTRERIRQIEAKALAALPRRLRDHPTVVRPQLEAVGNFDVEQKLPGLRAMFHDRPGFTALLEACVGAKRRDIFEARPQLPSSTTLLGDFFAEHAGPASPASCIAALQTRHGLAPDAARAYLEAMTQAGMLSQSADGLLPRNLSRGQAIAHVLVDAPEGLSWQAIVRRVQDSGVRSFATDRLEYYDGDSVYLCGPGAYRHVRYCPVDAAMCTRILREVRGWLQWRGLSSENLRRIGVAIARRTKVDYYDLRHVVRRHGAEAGLVFLGASRVDTVGLREAEIVPPVRVADAVLEVLAESEAPRSIEEVVAALQGGSTSNVKAKLGALAETGAVVRVAHGWTMLARALGDLDEQRAADCIDDLLRRTDKVVHVDAIREWLEPMAAVKLPTTVWLGIVRKHAGPRGWTVQGQLVAKHAFRWTSVRDAIRECVRSELTTEDAIARLRERLLLSRRTAARYLREAIAKERAAATARS